MRLLFAMLGECRACDDVLLVFSQNTSTLDIIEYFLLNVGKNHVSNSNFTCKWKRDKDYFRFDGKTNQNFFT